jgi:hypothetical protein
VSIDLGKDGQPLLLERFQTRNLCLVRRQQCVAADIREGWCKVEHLLFWKVQCVPKLLQRDTRFLDKQMQVLALQLVQPRQFVFVLVDGSHPTSAVAVQKTFALMVLDTQTLPQLLDGGAQLS